MKKLLLLLPLFAFFLVSMHSVSAQRPQPSTRAAGNLINESFETFPPTGWSLSTATTSGSVYWYSSDDAFATRVTPPRSPVSIDGDSCYAVFDAFSSYVGSQSLITPALSPTTTNHILSYKISQILLSATYIDEGIQIFVETSGDGTTWTPSTTNVLASVPNYNQAAGSLSSAVLTVDLTTYIGQTAYVRFRGVSDYGGFFAAIDSVTGVPLYVHENPELEVASVSSGLKSNYTPLLHAEEILPEAVVRNYGSDMATTATLNFAITPGAYDEDVTITALTSNTSDIFVVGAGSEFVPTNTGSYTLVASTDFTDSDATDNTKSTTFTITQDYFAMEDGSSYAGGVGSNSSTITFGNLYELATTDRINAFSIAFSSITSNTFKLRIYSVDDNITTATQVFESATFNRSSATAADVLTKFNFDPQTLNAGKYLFCIYQNTTSNIACSYDGLPNGLLYIVNATTGAISANPDFGNVAIHVHTLSEDVPAAPTAFTLTPEPTGLLSCDLDWTNPALNMGGAALASLTGIVIVRDNVPVDTLSPATIGGTATWTDNNVTNGMHTYKIYGYNNDGDGPSVSESVYVGIDPCASAITTFPWDEGFEGTDFPPTCWTSYNVDGGGTQWARTTSSTYVNTGTGAAWHNFAGSSYGDQEGWLVTPQMEIPEEEGYVLEFWTKTNYPTANVYSGILVSTNGYDPATATFVEEHQLSGTEISSTWKKITVELDDYAGESIYIGFKYTGTNADAWYIDDIRVYNASSFVDVEVVSITSPVSGLSLGVDTVKAIIKNNGVNAITDLDITLNVNGVETVETIPSLAAMSQMDYTFTQTVDLSTAGNYTISVYTSLANDQVVGNDTATITVTNTICGLITSFPWEEGFENAVFPPYCWYSYNVDGGGTQWARNTNATYIRTGTGSVGHSYGSGAQEGWLVTPPMEIPGEGYVLEFWTKYNYPGDNEYSGIMVSTNGNDPATATFVEKYQLSGAEISSSWKKVAILLDDYVGDSIYIGFKYMGNNADAWYIDDLRVYNAAAYIDVEVVSITSPVSGVNLGTDTVKAIVKNNGGAALTNLDIALNVNGVNEVIEMIPNIPAMSQITYTFTQTVDLSATGNHVIKVYTSLANDQVAGNDTAIVTITNTICETIDEFPWNEGFEAGSLSNCWTKEHVTGTTNWTVRTGNGSTSGGISTAHTGTYNLSFYHASSTAATTKLITPQLDITSLTNPALSFWHGQTAWGTSQDELRVYYKTSATGTWTQLAEFTNNITAWTQVTLPLPDGSDDYYIAFEGKGKYGRGIVIDDVKIEDYSGVIDAGVLSITAPVSGVNLSSTEAVTVTIRNNGSDAISNFPITLNVDGSDVVTETVTDTIPYLSQMTYTFTQTADLSAAGGHVIIAYTSLVDDQDAQNDTATVTINNTACPIINTFPWEEGFDNGISECWVNIDADGDGENWFDATLDGEPVVGSYSAVYYDLYGIFIPLTPDNYLITPQIALDADYALQFSVGGAHASRYAEKYSVMVSTTGTDPADFTDIHAEILSDFNMKTVVLPLNAYTGDTVYIAFRHWDCTDNFALILDNVKIFDIASMIDAEVASITHPASGSNLGTENVKVIIKNNGGTDISNFTLTLNVNGTDVATETYTGTIASLAQVEYTFNQSYNFSNAGGYTIAVSVNLANDTEPANDTCVKAIANFSTTGVTVYGYRIYDDEMDGETMSEGVISFNSNSPATVTEVSDYADGANTITGGEYYDGHLYLYSRTTSAPANFIKLSTTTWTATTTPISTICTDMAYDYSANVMYGLASGTSTSNLNTVDMTTGELTLVGDMGAAFFTLACNLQGDLFAVNTDGDFCSINKTTGTATVISSTGIDPNYIQSMGFDHNTGRLFWAMSNVTDDGKLVEIDPTSGAVIDRGVLGGNAEVVALYTPYTVNTAIEIVSLSPERDATGVEPTATVRVTFDGDIDVIDLSGVTISPDPGNVSASATGAVLTIAHDIFDHDTRYTVTIPAGAIDNYTADSPITWSFTVKGSGVSTIDLKAINMYPNPAKNQVQLTNLPEKSEITVYDVTGRVVKTCTANDSSFTMSVDFAPGTYFVKIENNNASTVKKLIVE